MTLSDSRSDQHPKMPSTVRPPSGSDLPRLPVMPSQRAVPTTPANRNGCFCRLLPHPARPSPLLRRVSICDFTFEACSGFSHVTARWIAQPPKAAFVTRLQPARLPGQAARQLTDLTDNCLGGSSFHWRYAPSGRTEQRRLSGIFGKAEKSMWSSTTRRRKSMAW